MSGFDDITVGWKGTEYKVPPNKCMGLLARIEEVLAPTGGANDVITALTQPHRTHLTKLACAYASALRYAGCNVSDEEVYLSLAKDVSKGGPDGFEALSVLSQGIITMFFPDWAKDEPGAEGDSRGNLNTDDRSHAASSENSMKPASEAASAVPETSGA